MSTIAQSGRSLYGYATAQPPRHERKATVPEQTLTLPDLPGVTELPDVRWEGTERERVGWVRTAVAAKRLSMALLGAGFGYLGSQTSGRGDSKCYQDAYQGDRAQVHIRYHPSGGQPAPLNRERPSLLELRVDLADLMVGIDGDWDDAVNQLTIGQDTDVSALLSTLPAIGFSPTGGGVYADSHGGQQLAILRVHK
jgi:hypothetical protein